MFNRVLRRLNSEAPKTSAFSSFMFPSNIENVLKKKNIIEPSEIQKLAWPIALQGKDLIGIAKTGSGKTLGYLLPMINYLLKANSNNMTLKRNQPPNALIILPTRELTNQVSSELSTYALNLGIKHAAIFGGAPKFDQKFHLTRGTHAVIGTPGRIADFLSDNILDLSKVNYLVVDEADMMLDMGFEVIVRSIISNTPETRQTLMFTATWPKEISILVSDLMNEPKKIQVGSSDLTMNENIIHKFIYAEKENQMDMIKSIIHEDKGGKFLIFTNTKRQTEVLKEALENNNIRAETLHSDKDQRERNYALKIFTMNEVKILIATDVASRGLDVKDIDYVVNYDLPLNLDDFIHRVGRTGRAGKQGVAVTFYGNNSKKAVMKGIINKLKEIKQNVPMTFKEIALEN